MLCGKELKKSDVNERNLVRWNMSFRIKLVLNIARALLGCCVALETLQKHSETLRNT